MKRSKITLWSIFSVIIILLIISIIVENEYIFFIPFFIIILGLILIKIIEFKIISNKIKPYFANENYFDAINYLDDKLKECFVLSNAFSCAIILVMTYMLVGETSKAKYLLERYKNIKKNRNLFYIQMIILISENRIAEARQYQQKLSQLKLKKFNNQRNTSVQIFEMIDTKRFDDNLYNNTKYPLLKTICLRYTNDEINGFDTNSLDQKKDISYYKRSGKIRFFSILINILTFLTLIAGLIIVAVVSDSYNPITAMDGMYYSLKTIWVYWLFIPISIGSIIFGLIFKKKNYKTTSNIIIGIVLSILLFGFGLMHFSGLKQYNTDSQYLINIGDTIHIDFPSDITIVTQNWTKGEQTSYDNIYYKYTSIVRFNNDSEILSFENGINNDNWLENFSDKTKESLPDIFTIETINYDKFLLYCYETKEYNPNNITLKYNYICIAYNKERKCLIIYEFTIK